MGGSNTNALVMDNSYYLTGNPYAQEGTFLADRTAVNTSSTITGAYATLIRNAGGNMYAEITNADTGEVYKTVSKGSAIRRILQFQCRAPGPIQLSAYLWAGP